MNLYQYQFGMPTMLPDPLGDPNHPPLPPGRYPLPSEPPIKPGGPPVERALDVGGRSHAGMDTHTHRWETHRRSCGVNKRNYKAKPPTHSEYMHAARQAFGNQLIQPNYFSFRYMGPGTAAQGALASGAVLAGVAIGCGIGYGIDYLTPGTTGGTPACGCGSGPTAQTLRISEYSGWGCKRSMRIAEEQAIQTCKSLGSAACKGGCSSSQKCTPNFIPLNYDDVPGFFSCDARVIFKCPCACF